MPNRYGARRTLVESNRVSEAFGCVLRDARLAQGISQSDLGLLADVDRTFIGLIERGTRQCTLTVLCKLARALDTAPSTLVARMERLLR